MEEEIRPGASADPGDTVSITKGARRGPIEPAPRPAETERPPEELGDSPGETREPERPVATPAPPLRINLAEERDARRIAAYGLYCVVEEPNSDADAAVPPPPVLLPGADLPAVVGDPEKKEDGQGVVEKLVERANGDADGTKLTADEWLEAFEGPSDIVDETFVDGMSSELKEAVWGKDPISLREFVKKLAILRLRCASGKLPSFHELRRSENILVHNGEETGEVARQNKPKLRGYYQDAERVVAQYDIFIREMGMEQSEMEDYLAGEFMVNRYLKAAKDKNGFDNNLAQSPYYRSLLYAAMLRYSGAFRDNDQYQTRGALPPENLWSELAGFESWAKEQGLEVGALDIKEERQWLLFMELLASYKSKTKEEAEMILRELRKKQEGEAVPVAGRSRFPRVSVLT